MVYNDTNKFYYKEDYIMGIVFGVVIGGALIAVCLQHEKDYDELITWKKERREKRVQ